VRLYIRHSGGGVKPGGAAWRRIGSALEENPLHRGAGPRRITFVTDPDDCNLACAMCREHSPHAPAGDAPPRRLALALVARVLDDLAGSRFAGVIPSTFGEPLLWRELAGLAGLCAARGLQLNVTTNGTFPRLGGAGWAQVLAAVTSDLKVSWNGACAPTAEAVMAGLRFDDSLRQLQAFREVRDRLRARGGKACSLSFQVTAMERNVAELPDIVRLAASLGVERVKVNQLQVHFPELAGEDLRRSPSSRARWNAAVRAMREAAAASPAGSGAGVRLQGAEEMDEAGADPAPGPCPFLGEEAWVLADGHFAPCPAPAAKEGRLGHFGSLREHALLDIWEGAGYRALRSGYRSHPECVPCSLRRPGGL
jgi:MoaA/NifB/PqqE/SkfB family radical SAM enzyme